MLKPRLSREISGVFNWIMAGRERLLANNGKFTQSNAMRKIVSDAKQDSNSVWGFLEENRYYPKKTLDGTFDEIRILARDLMAEYKKYCLVWGNTPKSKKGFLADMQEKGYDYRQCMSVGGATSTGYVMYKLVTGYGGDSAEMDDIAGERMMRDEGKVTEQDLPF